MAAYHCCVPHCANDSRYNNDNSLSFHKFPKDSTLQKQWIIKIRRDVGENFRLSDATRVCSAHFESSVIVKTLVGKRMLKPGSVPTLFSWTTAHSKRQKRVRRETAIKPNNIEINGNASLTFEPDPDIVPLSTHDHDYDITPNSMAEQLEAARQEVDDLREQLVTTKNKLFFLERFTYDPHTINFYTGFKDYMTLKSVFLALRPSAESMIRWNQMQRHLTSSTANIKLNAFREESLSLIDQFFLFLCRVHQGLPELDLAIKFNISQASVSRILITWANYLYVMLGSLQIWPSRKQIDENMPQEFKQSYPRTRVIIDCTELKVQTPSSRVLNSNLYSHYKSHTTFKGLIGITPCGYISFVSSLYTGSISDKAITSECGLLDLIQEGDEVMADKGFLIQDLLSAKGASLVIPPFLEMKGQFSEDEVKMTHDIARLRIHVERAIRRIKEFHVFDGVIPLNLASSINQLWSICAVLTNMCGPLF